MSSRRARPALVRRLAWTSALVGALVMGSVPAIAAEPDDPGSALDRLRADADGALSLTSDEGALEYVGVPSGTEVATPGVEAADSARVAARAAIERYGEALGAHADSLEVERVLHTTGAGSVVHYQQYVDGVPVLGGEVVVGLRGDRSLASISSSLGGDLSVTAPTVSQDAAKAAALASVPGEHLTATAFGRWIFDPAVAGAPTTTRLRTVWRFEVGDGAAVRRFVLVDDATGRVAFSADLIQHLDRVVCDEANSPWTDADLNAGFPECDTDFARVEGEPATGVADVDLAYDLSGAVSDFYDDVAGIDLTDLLGLDVGGDKKLASTVRICFSGEAGCPYANAFWSGAQMYYGEGYANADDVVGHEMTHGVIDRNSALFYWGQSGAINESLADIMGEFIDLRYGSDPAGDAWKMGEDLPYGEIRDLEAPGDFSQPDRMTSSNWWKDPNYLDAGGVHTNSGVGNKTAYLISQGGSFNGVTMTGLDVGDPTYAKSSALWYDVIVGLSSGSDYANLADVLEQSCENLAVDGTAGFVAADCDTVENAVAATELRTTPTKAAQPADAEMACPANMSLRVLFDSEAGDPEANFTEVTGTGWTRDAAADYPWLGAPNAIEGDSWFGVDPYTIGGDGYVPDDPINTMRSSAIELPSGQPSYLWFQSWRVFQPASAPVSGGTIDLKLGSGGTKKLESAPWVNGPDAKLADQAERGGRTAFTGDSLGWVASRADLSEYAGESVQTAFTTSGGGYGLRGWFLDDVTVYTCDVTAPSAVRGIEAKGGSGSATIHWKAPKYGAALVTGYLVEPSAGAPFTVTERSAQVGGVPIERSVTVSVTPQTAGDPGTSKSIEIRGTKATISVKKGSGSHKHDTIVSGSLRVAKGSKWADFGKQKVTLYRVNGMTDKKLDSTKTSKKGSYSFTVEGTKKTDYLVFFGGGDDAFGTSSPRRSL